MVPIILTIVFFLPILIESKEHWSYENIKNWSHDYHYCGGNRQSPINLLFNISHYTRRLEPMYVRKQFSSDSPLQLINNGHTAQLNLKNHYLLKHVALQSEDYKVEQLHFHWGHSGNIINGSEHLLDGQSYPLEMHIVTYSSLFSNLSEAMTNVRALAVVGVFFELSNQSNEFLQPIVKTLPYIQHKGNQQYINDDFSLINLIGGNHLHRYYRYDGSLTTPPCYESVIWSVVPEPLKLSLDQLAAFQALHDEKDKLMKNTYRSEQSIGTRKLFRSFHLKNIDDESKEHISTGGCHGQYLSINMKIVFVLISFLMIII